MPAKFRLPHRLPSRHAVCSMGRVMSKIRLVVSLVLVSLVPLGCAEDEVVADDVAVGWRTTSTVLAAQQLQWGTEAHEDGTLAVTGACPDGGSASVEGTYDSEQALSVTLTFASCRADGITIAGNLAMTTEIVVADGARHRDPRRLAGETGGTAGEVCRCPTESRTVGEHVPQNLAEADDRRDGSATHRTHGFRDHPVPSARSSRTMPAAVSL